MARMLTTWDRRGLDTWWNSHALGFVEPDHVLSQKGEHRRVEFFVERDTIKTRCVRTEFRAYPRHGGRAWPKEGEVRGVWNDVVLMCRWQALLCDLDVLGKHTVAAVLGLPKLHRHGDAGIALLGEHDGQGVGDHRCLDPRIVRERLCRKLFSADLIACMG